MGMARLRSFFVRWQQAPDEIRGIADDEVILLSGKKMLERCVMNVDLFRPGGSPDIFSCLVHILRLKFHGIDTGFRGGALREHDGDETRAGPDVKYGDVRLTQVYPCAQQDAVGPYFVGAPVLGDAEFLKLKRF